MKSKRCLSFILYMAMLFMIATPCQAATVKLNKKSISVQVGQSVKLKLKKAKGKVTWKSTNRSIVAVSKKGTVLAKKAGKCKVIATYNTRKYICNVKVRKGDSMAEQQPGVEKTTEQATTTIPTTEKTTEQSNDTKQDANITSQEKNTSEQQKEDIPITSIKMNKNVAMLFVEDKKSAFDDVREDSSCYKRLNEAARPETTEVTGVTIGVICFTNSKSNKELNLTATVTAPYNTTDEKTITWKSSNPDVAVVDDNGGVTPVGCGECVISAMCGRLSTECKVTVVDDNLANIVNNDAVDQVYDLNYIVYGKPVIDSSGYVVETKYPIDHTDVIKVKMHQEYETELIKKNDRWWLGIKTVQKCVLTDVNIDEENPSEEITGTLIPSPTLSNSDSVETIFNPKRQIQQYIVHEGKDCYSLSKYKRGDLCKTTHTIHNIQVGKEYETTQIQYVPMDVDRTYDITSYKYDCEVEKE